jgi:ADP-ribose pyrophosphatase YjhB (NUDIX family)
MKSISIRNSAKAIIIKEGKILLTKNKDNNGEFYLLPGGGQEHGETLIEALKRECLEEISAEVKVGELKLVREYIGGNHEFAEWDSDFHQVEFMFKCDLVSEEKLEIGYVPDEWQIGLEWIALEELDKFRIYPSELLKYLGKSEGLNNTCYLGDVN